MTKKMLGRNNVTLLKKILSLVLALAVIGVTPGINNLYNLKSAKAIASETRTSATNPFHSGPFSVKLTSDSSNSDINQTIDKGTDEDKLSKPQKVKKGISTLEDISWLVARSLLPTIAVMAFSAAVACPLVWLVAGSVLIGAATAGIVTFGYEMRKNHFKAKKDKKSIDKIMRDVSIMAAINGAMAPFQIATAGLVSAVGPATIRSVATTAAKTFAVQAASKAVIYGSKAAVMNAWYDHYYNYDEREKYLNYKIAALKAIKNRTASQSTDLATAISELETISKEKYTFKNFRKDMKKGLIWAGVSGVLGGATARVAGDMKWAKIASSKIFGTPDRAGMLANAVTSNPFAFATGAGMDLVEKRSIIKEIKLTRKIQSEYKNGTPVWEYYEEKINSLQKKHDAINLVDSGTRMAISNAAVQVAMVGTTAATTRWSIYTSQKKKIQDEYEATSSKWAKANETRMKLEQLKNAYPRRTNFRTNTEYKFALKAHKEQVLNMRKQYQAEKLEAVAEQNLPVNREKFAQIARKVKSEELLNKRLALAKAIGKDEYLRFKVKQLRAKPENNNLSDKELATRAREEIHAEYLQAAKNRANELSSMLNKMKGTDTKHSSGKIEIGTDGKKYIVVRDRNGTELLRKPYSGVTETWWQKIFKTDKKSLENKAIKNAIKLAYNKGASVKPSLFRDKYIEMRINQLKARGLNNSQIDKLMSSLTKEANSEMLKAFGGSWTSVIKSEVIAQGLDKAKYNDGEAPSLADIGKFVKSNIKDSTFGSLGRNLRGQLSNTSFIGEANDNSIDTQVHTEAGQAVNKWLSGLDGYVSTSVIGEQEQQ